MHNGAIMPTEVRHRMETGQPLPVVRLFGVLDLDTLGERQAALWAGLDDQSGPLVLDLSGLTVGDPKALAEFTHAVRRAADWPAIDLVIYAPDAHRWTPTGRPVRAHLDAALSALEDFRPTQRLATVLEPVVGAARRARELVTEACARWELPELAGPACIVITEMVNNVVAHARTPMTVSLALRDGTVTVAVRDADPTPPTAHGMVPPTAYGGRGLLLIEAVALRWGTCGDDGGKVVWAVLDSEDEDQ
jgi:hypothetical protein